ncbi:MAG: AAA family ATPase [Sulfuricaulis sp.]
MYESFYGLKEKPFSMLPDPAYLYLSRQHEMAMTLLDYSLENQAGFCVISGRAGTGKTTLVRRMLNRIGDDITVGLVSNTHHSFGELLRWILHAYGLEDSGKTQAEWHQVFIDFLIQQYAKNQRTMLIIDEAQNMSSGTLEELRMLSNINPEKDLLLQVILVGQPALRDILRRPELEQFAQRVVVDYHLDALGQEETKNYIHHRLRVAGGETELFTEDACEAVFGYSEGIPRLINLLCDFSLVYAYAGQAAVVTEDMVRQVVREREEYGALPIFPHAGKAPAQRVLEERIPRPMEVDAAGSEAAPVSSKAKHAGIAVGARGVTVMDTYGKALQPRSAVTGKNRAHAAKSSPARETPHLANTPNAKTTPATGAQDRIAVAGAEHIPAEAPASFVADTDDIFASSSVSEIEPGSGSATVAQGHDPETANMSDSADTEKTCSISEYSDDAPTTLGTLNRASLAQTNLPKRDQTTPVHSIGRRKADRASSLLKRYVPAAVLVLALGIAFAWNFFKRTEVLAPVKLTAIARSPVEKPIAPPAPVAASSPVPAGKSGSPAGSPDNPSAMHQASIEPVVTSKASRELERKMRIERQREAARAILQAAERERAALRATLLAQERAKTAEHEAALAQERARASQLALEAEKEKAASRATTAARKNPEPGAPQPAVSSGLISSVPATAGSSPQKAAEVDTGAETGIARASEPVRFTANPCKGPSARFLSTCE